LESKSGKEAPKPVHETQLVSSFDDVVKSLAPSALLGLVAQAYMRRLARLGLDALLGQSFYTVRKGSNKDPDCLTPSHIYRGLLRHSFSGGLNEVIFASVANIGIPDMTVP
jgi:hypothetical protein